MPKKPQLEPEDILPASQKATDLEEKEETGQDEFEPSDEEEIDDQTTERETDTSPVVPEELAAINTDNETAEEQNETEDGEKKKKKSKAVKKAKKAKPHSTNYLKARESVDAKEHSLEEGIELAIKSKFVKFDPTIELHIRLNLGKGKTDSGLRGTLNLPSGSVKERKVVVLDEATIEKIEKGFSDFDIALATPAMMPKVAKLAKILGPKGKMPSPKSGTVVEDPEKAKLEFAGGKIEYKTDAQNIIHVPVGKASWGVEKVRANAETVLEIVPKPRIRGIAVNATMGPGIRIELPK